ncbi:MAG: alanine racemase [Herpetosiphonaceae bacterium]|nr:alanine racemase [Herpetosiphonaceae bacterium]
MIELDELLQAGGTLCGPVFEHTFADWCYDSRLAEPGQCFVALRTERRDGHAFIRDALARGCTGVLCSQPEAGVAVTMIQVADVRATLQRWASSRLQRYAPHVIGVTGSVGKTSTKRAIATVLGALGPVFSSRRSFNSLLGLPLTLAHLLPEQRWAVLEMGVDRFGEMERLASLFPPHIAAVTNVAPTHLHYLRDEAHIAQEKCKLVAALPPDGYAVLNADDPLVRAMAEQTAASIFWYSCAPELVDECKLPRSPFPILSATNITVTLDGTCFDLHYDAAVYPATVPFVGEHTVYAALAAIAVALCCGLPCAQAVARLPLIERQAGRLNPLPGLHGSTIIDDSYNASPRSVEAALRTLAALPARRRIAVLGPMLELGEQSTHWHQALGVTAASVCDLVLTVGDLAAQFVPPHPNSVQSLSRFNIQATNADALAFLRPQLGPGDLVLVKGSAAARMEQIVAGLLPPTVNVPAVLVRQEAAWEKVRVAEADRPTWLEIDLGAIAHNAEQLRHIVGAERKIMAVLKADAYGHGALPVARTVLQHGATHLAVATLGEAMALRNAGIGAPLLILGYTPPWQVRDALRYNVELALWDAHVAREISIATEELQRTSRVHVKVDTGMARLGLALDEAPAFLHFLHDLPGIDVVGIFTHLATADSADPHFAQIQLRRFDAVLQDITAAGLRPPLVHAANSATILRYPQAYYDLVRPGICLYGLSPSNETPCPAGFRPALQFKTEIAQIKTLPAGAPVSYGATWQAPRPSTIATIPIGYADGFRRSPAWQAVLVNGRRAPITGRVCMDYTMIDITNIPGVRVGTEVVLIGPQGTDCITAEEVAGWLGTINYEVVAAILPRVPRLV